ncbi:unnamed protein product [Prorocentrum cordatum]|uniref:Uncharacterized protein n=1 Tax=Prorocentrum cordatum TaxID=2364126 RepID=A0ABN9VBH4_9DINO|nr:unnamed protein product [Polarella glacialis]
MHCLTHYCSTMRNTLLEATYQYDFEDGDQEKIEKALDDTLVWTRSVKAQTEGKEELEGKQKEVESIVTFLRMKLARNLVRKIVGGGMRLGGAKFLLA